MKNIKFFLIYIYVFLSMFSSIIIGYEYGKG